MRLRSTAPPTCLLTVKPNRGWLSCRAGALRAALPPARSGGRQRRRCERAGTRAPLERRERGARLRPCQDARDRACCLCRSRLAAACAPGVWPCDASRRMRRSARLAQTLAALGAAACTGRGVHRPSPCACESRGGACERAGSADRCASRLLSRIRDTGSSGCEITRGDGALARRSVGSAADPAGIAGAYRVAAHPKSIRARAARWADKRSILVRAPHVCLTLRRELRIAKPYGSVSARSSESLCMASRPLGRRGTMDAWRNGSRPWPPRCAPVRHGGGVNMRPAPCKAPPRLARARYGPLLARGRRHGRWYSAGLATTMSRWRTSWPSATAFTSFSASTRPLGAAYVAALRPAGGPVAPVRPDHDGDGGPAVRLAGRGRWRPWSVRPSARPSSS